MDISWQTSSEINSDYFELEKSADGNNFILIDNVSAAGNSNSVLNYNYIDENENNSYYRLSQYDLNGEKYIYEIKHANCISNTNEFDYNACFYSNEIIIDINNANTNNIHTILITDNIGRQLINKQVLINSEVKHISINNVNLANGVYNVSIFNDASVNTKQIIILN